MSRNGTESRESLPLWFGAKRENGSERPLEGTATIPVYRNGTKSRDSLPLWCGGVEWRTLHRWPDEWVAGWFKLVKCRQYGNSGKYPFLHTGKDMKCKNAQSLP